MGINWYQRDQWSSMKDSTDLIDISMYQISNFVLILGQVGKVFIIKEIKFTNDTLEVQNNGMSVSYFLLNIRFFIIKK